MPLGNAESIGENKREKYETTQGCRECIVEQSIHNFRSIGDSLRVSLFRVSLDRERAGILVRSSEKLSGNQISEDLHLLRRKGYRVTH